MHKPAKPHSLLRITLLVTAVALLLLVSNGYLPHVLGVGTNSLKSIVALQDFHDELQAEQVIQRAWILAQQASAYDFHTEIEQTTYHAPALTNVGRPAHVDSLYLEGSTDTKTKNFQVAIWQGGSILERDRAYEIHTDGEYTYGRPHGGQWEQIDNVTTVFAPNRDMLAYLHSIKNVHEVQAAVDTYRQFQFDLDSPAFAAYMRQQLEDQLRGAGKLPPGITLDTPYIYQGIDGGGEIWLTSEGMPARLNFTLDFPQFSDGRRVHAVIRTDFTNFESGQLVRADAPLGVMLRTSPIWLANQVGRLTLVDWSQMAVQLSSFMLLALCAWLIVRIGRKRPIYIALNSAIIISIVGAPLLQSVQAAAFQQEQIAAQQAYAMTQAATARQVDDNQAAWDPQQSPLAMADARAALAARQTQSDLQPQAASSAHTLQQAVPAAVDSDQDGVPDAEEPIACVGMLDCDADTLTDLQEFRLGTALDKADSDNDKLRDDLEVKGFRLGDRLWYADPNNFDSNKDGLADTLECWSEDTALDLSTAPANLACNRDTDLDGIPDLFELDNDGDGIDDSIDLSPFHQSEAIHDQQSPFVFQSDNLTPNEPLFVDFQIVPTSREQIAYARNVLDWPKNDTKGQVVRTQATTFATGKTSGNYLPNEEMGDLRLIPMVEVTIPAEDASRILPVTEVLTITRTGIGYEKVISDTQPTQSTEQPWLQVTLALRALPGGKTTIDFAALTDKAHAPTTVDKVQIFQDACPVDASAQPVLEKTSATGQGDLWELAQDALPNLTTLPNLLNGNHVIVISRNDGGGGTPRTLCMPLGDIPNGALPFWEMFDTAKLDAYGVSLRDVLDAQGYATTVTAYMPANVVTGQAGGEKQAFGARMPYWPTTNSLGAAQEVRLVWMVQLLGDDGSTQIVHTYLNEGWKLAGLSARQDIEMRSAVIYQNPDSEYNSDVDTKAIHARLWPTANVLDAHFAKAQTDRLRLDDTLLSRLESEYGAHPGSLGAVVTTYQTQDELARVPTEVTPTILAKFLNNGTYRSDYDHVLLLFAREEEYKVANWRGGDTLTLPAAVDTLTSYSWKPFRHTADGWGAFPARDYLDLLHVRLQQISAVTLKQENLSPDDFAATLDGMVLANQAFVMGMLYGANRLVALDAVPVERAEAEENSLPQDIGNSFVGSLLNTLSGQLAEELAKEVGKVANVTARASVTSLGNALKTKTLEIKGSLGKGGDLSARLGTAGLSLAVVSLGLTLGKLINGNESAATALDTTLSSLAVISASLDTVKAVTEAAEAAKGSGAITAAMKSAAPMARAAKIAAVVGLVITVGIAVGVFMAQWITGAFSLVSLGFTAALSGVIATVIVAALMLAIAAIPIVGPVIVAVIALIDGLIAGICAVTKAAGFDLEKATTLEIPRTSGAKLSFCAGITGLATEGVRFLIFSQTVLVGNMQASDRLATSNFQLNLQAPNLGFQVGNSIRPSLRVDNKIELVDQPFDWKSALYFWQFNWDFLDNTTHRYDLTTTPDDRDVSTSEMEGEWQELKDGALTGSHHSPGIHYDDPLVMVPVTATLPNAQATIPFTTAGINVPVALYLREAYANPAQECFSSGLGILAIPICYIRGGDTGTNNIDLRLAYDIFPTTLDEFYAGQRMDEGVSLAWGQSGDVTFPVMQDFDGDGLRSAAFGGNDPDDLYWDVDGDQLSDLFETQNGTQANVADTDGDGLDDRVELLIGTDPRQSDSDGDGLLDGQEIFHQDILDQDGDGDRAEWLGGWAFVYDIVDNVAQSTWVTSDPSAWDTDNDGLSDAQEQLYGLNPRVPSDAAILNLTSQVVERDAPITLLRFEERAGATVFADASGQVNNASCMGDGCPQAGHEGKYTNGLRFDGVDDLLHFTEAVPLANHSFTVAFWLQRNRMDASEYVLVGGTPEANHALGIGFTYEQEFSCGFQENELRELAPAPDTAWHHWACTYDMSTQTRIIYRDGVELRRDTSVPYLGSDELYIGGHGDYPASPRLHSTLDELVVVPTALDADKIVALMEARYNPGGLQLQTAPGAPLSYDATLENTLLGQSLTGLLVVDAPAAWINTAPLTPYRLAPQQTQPLRGELTIDPLTPSGSYSVTFAAGAAVVAPAQAAATTLPAADVYLDFNSNQQDVTKFGTPVTAQGGVEGNALQMDGRTVLEINNAAFDVSNTPFTFALWVKPEADTNRTQGTRALFGQPPTGREWSYTNSGVFLRLQDGRNLHVGWGDGWNGVDVPNVVTPGEWNHIVVAYNQTDLSIYVNGTQVSRTTARNSLPRARQLLSIGDDNYCAEFELKNVYTVEDGDGPGSAEYRYLFHDETDSEHELIYDEDADSGDWEPGDGAPNNEIFTDKKQTFCGVGAYVYVYEDDDVTSNEHLTPDIAFDFATANHTGYNKDNYAQFETPELRGDGRVKYYYEIRNPVLPFQGSIDELRLYRRALGAEEVQQLYGGAGLAYHFTLDDPPGAGLDSNKFNFAAESGAVDAVASGYCLPGECPDSGVPGRVNRAVAFGGLDALQIDELKLPAKAPGFSLWAKPHDRGAALRLTTKDQRLLFYVLWYDNMYCVNQGVCSEARYPADQWAHLMVNFDGGGAHLYVNGVQAVTDPALQWLGANTYSLRVGDGWTGLIDDLRIPYDGQNVAAMMTTAPVVALHLDETGTAISDFENVGGSHATCSGTGCPETGRTGKLGHAAAFNGVEDGLTIPDSDPLDLNHFTLAAWVKPTANAADQQPILGKNTPDGMNYALYLTNERKLNLLRVCRDGRLEATSVNTLPLEQYTHVAATYDGAHLSLYINGVLDTSVQVASAPACGNNSALTVGMAFDASIQGYRHFSGLLDEIVIYANALWDYEIKDLYNAQANWFEAQDAHNVVVDAEPPVSSLAESLPLATNTLPNADIQLGVTATDASSEVTLLELGVSFNGGPTTWTAVQPCQDATQGNGSSPAWCPWFKPSQWGGAGSYSLQTRATDAVGNRETPTATYAIGVDGSGPQLTVTQTDLLVQKLLRHPQIATAQVLPLDGTVSDSTNGDSTGRGVRHVWVTLRNLHGEVVGDAPYAATLNGESWSLQYPFYQAQVAGKYTLEVVAEDGVGNQSTLPPRTLLLDGAPRGMTLNESISGLPNSQTTLDFITKTTVFQGWLSDNPLPAGVGYVYPFEEKAGVTAFANAVANSGWLTPSVATCSGTTCPTAEIRAQSGFGIAFDGVDDYVTLPVDVAQSDDFTFAAWVLWQGGKDWERILDLGQDTSRYLFLTTTTNDGKLRFAITENGIGGEQILQTDTSMPRLEWVHVAVVLEGDTGRIYVNGVEHARNTITINPRQVAGSNLWLGRSQFATDPYFHGMLDQVVIYHHALSSDEVSVLASTQVADAPSTAPPQDAATPSSSLSFTPLWAAERSGILSPHVALQQEGQTLYLPLDETANPENATSTFRNLANENASSASCNLGQCPEPGSISPAGGSVDFDGVDDYVSLPGNVKESDDFTFAAWVYWRGGQPWQRVFDFGQDENNYLYFTPSRDDNTMMFALRQGGGEVFSLKTATPLPTNQWVHLAVTLAGDTGRIYLNGVEQANGPITLNPSQIVGENLWLGRSQFPNDAHFNGMMGDVRVFARGLSSEAIRALWLGDRALLSLPFDAPLAADGALLTDDSGWKQPAILHSGVADGGNKAVPGHQGSYALDFDGVDDYVSLPVHVKESDDFTFAAWVYWRGGEVWQRLFDFGQDDNNYLYFTPNTSRNTMMVSIAQVGITSESIEFSPALPTDQWVHVVVMLEGENARVFLNGIEQTGGRAFRDGVEQTTNPITLNPRQIVGKELWLGRSHFVNDPYLNGIMDDVRVYARALKVAEINDLANTGWRQVDMGGGGSSWSIPIPAGLEGVYRVDLLSSENGTNIAYNPQTPAANHIIDTIDPHVSYTRQATSADNQNQYVYTLHADDFYLAEVGLVTPCGDNGEIQRGYRLDRNVQNGKQLTALTVTCTLDEVPASEVVTVCDIGGNCTAISPVDTQAFDPSQENSSALSLRP